MSSAADVTRAKDGQRITAAGCTKCALQYSWLSLLVNSSLALLKVVVGLLAGSRALVASAMYSVNDVLSGAVVIVSMRISRRKPDEQYTYGYGNSEYIAIGIVSTLVTGGVIFLLAYSVIDIIRGGHGAPHPIAIPVAAVALMTNYYLAKRGRCIASQTQSPVVETAAHHNHADAEGSLLTIIGVGGATLGFHMIDPIVAIIETLHIVWLAGSLFGTSIRGLMDTALPPTQVLAVAQAAAAVDGVSSVVSIRTRQTGSYAWIDAEIEVAEDTVIDEAQKICQNVAAVVDITLPHQVRSQVKFRVSGQVERPKPTSELEAAIAAARLEQGAARVPS